ncbi:MAG: AraC family transcriptional regulator [Calditrichaceae bacterium]
MEISFIDVVAILYAFGAVILIIFLLASPSKRPLSNRLLAAYLFISLLDISARFLSVYVFTSHPGLGMVLSETVFFMAPLLYLFFKSSVYIDFKLSKRSLLHFLPYPIILIVLIPGYFIPLLNNPDADWVELLYETDLYKVTYISLHVQIFVYYVLIFRMLYKYKQIVLENYSSQKLENYKWLLQFILLFSFEMIVATLKNIIRFNSAVEIYNLAQNIVVVLILSIIFWLIIKALLNPKLFSGVYIDVQLVKTMLNSNTNSKNADSAEKLEQDNDQLIRKLRVHMKEHEPYLDSNLSIYDLAKQLNVPARELSVSINHTLNKHFFDFINEYRIKKAMDLIQNSSDEKLTILEILYEVGFNSKSSFNTAFKKHSGITPTEFKKNASLRVA